ncbi:MAG: recombination protein RecR [Shewanellaceae bacterium]|nr:recombination protein RecR [Shewanellaceae bacterium]
MQFSRLLDELIRGLQILPGIGPKSAQRLAFHLLKQERSQGAHLAEIMQAALERVGHCDACRTFTEDSVCSLCLNEQRTNARQLCVVESPADILALESSGHFSGHYFVLHGLLSPLDGIGPDDIALPKLQQRLAHGVYDELILATNPTVEGDVTAHFILDIAKRYDIAVTRIAHGVPVGGELEYMDGTTLGLSFSGRRSLS